jgi:hypothetical protein
MGGNRMITFGYVMIAVGFVVVAHSLRPKYWESKNIPPTLSSIDIVRALVKSERRSGNE